MDTNLYCVYAKLFTHTFFFEWFSNFSWGFLLSILTIHSDDSFCIQAHQKCITVLAVHRTEYQKTVENNKWSNVWICPEKSCFVSTNEENIRSTSFFSLWIILKIVCARKPQNYQNLISFKNQAQEPTQQLTLEWSMGVVVGDTFPSFQYWIISGFFSEPTSPVPCHWKSVTKFLAALAMSYAYWMTCWVFRRKSGWGSSSGVGGQSLHSSLSLRALVVNWFRASCTRRDSILWKSSTCLIGQCYKETRQSQHPPSTFSFSYRGLTKWAPHNLGKHKAVGEINKAQGSRRFLHVTSRTREVWICVMHPDAKPHPHSSTFSSQQLLWATCLLLSKHSCH